MEQEGKSPKSIQSVVRAIKIMQYIAESENAASLTAISKELDLSKSTVHGLIATLKQQGYVYQNQTTGLYKLGLKLFELGQVVYKDMDLRKIAKPHLYDLVRSYEETVHIAVLSDGEVVYIEKVDSPRSIRIHTNVGSKNPAHCTSVGKALLAGLSEKKFEQILSKTGLCRFTDKTIIDLLDLKKEMELIRRCGYATDDEEIEVGLRCVAAPIKNHQGEITAAISVAGPTARMTDERMAEIAKGVIKVANQISSEFGYKNNRWSE